jgi:class 3 adenylate cyclase
VALGSLGSRALSRLDLTVIGPAVNAAARLEGLATRGQILISERAFTAARGAFEFESLEPVALPGHDGLVKVFNIVKRIVVAEPSPMSDARTVQMDESSVRFAGAADADKIGEVQVALDGSSINR